MGLKKRQSQIIDRYSKRIAKLYRKANDVKMKIVGTEVNILVLKVTDINSLGDTDTEVKSSKEIPAVISYPFNDIPIFRGRDADGNVRQNNMVYLEDILPIELFVGLEYEITLEENDLVIHILEDEKGVPIPQIFKCGIVSGNFYNKYLVMKKFQLIPFRNNINENIMQVVDEYVKSIYNDEFEETYSEGTLNERDEAVDDTVNDFGIYCD